ncbi:MAG: hypothetical protein COU46_00930 [Candidatus Niyogibacteria bacterium CG10_big_fil_rev_8_21_14_0_10_42_19]|uniref:Uncharacterized protein n=1 Tax=Candidatus Niyogibacteria bacterium CG10_big_fil_rev_8_21_14_0_10_42_19 TaxID=1974725 RepID=A0A2H0TID0_9BACT|nr:MAG: hypothetical protein COU46_00930 [Candidatus Niyogibacteria bacterium CG10_big_fil_rev_8_21_14_0_10_42_19]
MRQNSIIKFNALILASALIPLFASAQTFEGVIMIFIDILGLVIPILMILATVVFLWGIISYLVAAGDEAQISKSKTYMVWGIIALFVMLTVWGFVAVIQNTFEIDEVNIPNRIGDP